MDIDTPDLMEYFLNFSAAVTGFSRFDLLGTGQASLYFSTIEGIIGGEIFRELLQTFHELYVRANSENDASILTEGITDQILMSGKLGPIASNIIKLWYSATWYQLPDPWREKFGARQNDTSFVVSPYAYPEGLLWQAIGVNPPGAKAPGYASWQYPPSVRLTSPKN
ncbi:MAG: hypothetical protein QNJ70_09935 [Xenococcaceae cyanobacterium MO_207.B15]|nr:hypothetical protein [Xenococcaceae cyanobacterium MO_207.B15]